MPLCGCGFEAATGSARTMAIARARGLGRATCCRYGWRAVVESHRSVGRARSSSVSIAILVIGVALAEPRGRLGVVGHRVARSDSAGLVGVVEVLPVRAVVRSAL